VETVLELEVRCTACRNGLVGSDEWAEWYTRADEIEAEYLATNADSSGLESSEAWLALVDERPAGPEEVSCAECEGTGVVLTETGRHVLAWAQRRFADPAA
jgi:hypothetical protein